MTAQLWIGFGFLALLIVFLIVSFFLKPHLTDDQRGNLKLLSALCAGFAGGFLTGGALFEMHKTTGGTTFGISGTAGFALFLTVWFFYPRVFSLPDGFAFAIAAGWTFRDTADRMAQSRASAIDWAGFSANELNAAMQNRGLATKSLAEALIQLGHLTVAANAVRPYDVAQDGALYRLRVRQRE
jgi:hypothetical protein